MLNFNLERLKRKQMESEIEYLHNEVQRLTKELDEANATISNLNRAKENVRNTLAWICSSLPIDPLCSALS